MEKKGSFAHRIHADIFSRGIGLKPEKHLIRQIENSNLEDGNQLAAQAKEALSRVVDEEIRNRLINTLEILKEALLSDKKSKIDKAKRDVQSMVMKVMSVEERPHTLPTRDYLLAFEASTKKKLEDVDTQDTAPITFIVDAVKNVRSAKAVFRSASKAIFGINAPGIGRQLCCLIRNGHSPEEAKRLVTQEGERSTIDADYLQAFESGSGKKIEDMLTTDRDPVIFVMNSLRQKKVPSSLFNSVSLEILGVAKPAAGRQLCIHIRDGKNAKEAKQLVEKEEKESTINANYLRAFEKCAGKKLEEMEVRDFNVIHFTVGNTKHKRSAGALFSAVASTILDKSRPAAGRQFCIYIRDGKTPDQAKSLLEEAERNTSIDSNYLKAFEVGSEKRIEEMEPRDFDPVTFTIGLQEQRRSPSALFQAVSQEILGSKNQHAGRELCIYIRDGYSHEEAKKMWQQKREQKEHESTVDQTYLRAFEEAIGEKFENISPGDTRLITFTVTSIQQKRSPQALFQSTARAILGNPSLTRDGRQICIHVRDGKSFEEAKKLVLLGDEGIEDEEFEKLGKLNIDHAIALFGHDPAKLKVYLQYAYPELSEEERDRLVIRSFKGLVIGRTRTKEEEYLKWDAQLPSVRVETKIPRKTEKNTLTISGKAPRAECVYIAGCYNRRVRVEPDGTFTVVIPLKTGEENEIRIMSINRTEEVRSHQEALWIHQTGEPDDIAELVRLLGELRGDLLRDVQQDPGRMQLFTSCAEHLLIKKFSRSFAEGEEYVQGLLRDSKSPVLRTVLKTVLKNFNTINRQRLPNVQKDRLMFFQKYCAFEIRKRMQGKIKGVNLANDPGLGKTRTILAALGDEDASIFTPNPIVSTWEEEGSEILMDPDLLVLRDVPHAERKQLLREANHLRLVTNVQFLQKPEDAERFELLSTNDTVVVHDEAHSRASEQSNQSKGARNLRHKFQINVTATLAKNPKKLRRMLHTIDPEDKRFTSDKAFAKAFPANDPEALKILKLLVDKYTIRFRKEDVMEEVDPDILLSQQLHRLPRKEHVPPEEMGEFEMSEEQAHAIYEMFLDWNHWTQRYGQYIPDDEVSREDHLRSSGSLIKRHALRQSINNPSFIGSKAEDAKAKKTRKIVERCLREDRKIVIFCTYTAQALKYAEIFKKYKPALYTGFTSKDKEKKDEKGLPCTFKREAGSHGFKRGWVFDAKGYPVEDAEGETMPALDYERLTFQNAADRKLIICTYKAGSVGTTFTAGKAMIFDDLPADVIEDIQAEDRIHRIDSQHQTHHSVKYYSLRSRYPESFLQKMRRRWVVKQQDGTYEEYTNMKEAEKAGEEIRELFSEENDAPIPANLGRVSSAYDQFFAQGTYDEVQGRNLEVQRQMFHLINDGIADTSILTENQTSFFGINGNGKNGNGNGNGDQQKLPPKKKK